jgi:diguanylate cyclase (GGDEF)-like protein
MLSQFSRTKNALSMLVIDMDFFKRINDRYGHSKGENVLRYFGRLLTECGRKSDLISRFGEEKFLILLPDNNLEKTIAFSKNIT